MRQQIATHSVCVCVERGASKRKINASAGGNSSIKSFPNYESYPGDE